MEPNFFHRYGGKLALPGKNVKTFAHHPMNKALLFQQFDRIAEAPEAIPRLRRFILDLAVRGKLVPTEAELAQQRAHAIGVKGKVAHASSVKSDTQDACATFEPASELLKRIEAEKARLVNEGKIRKPKPLPPIDPDDVPFELPEGWEWVRLGRIIHLISGQHLKPGEYTEEPGEIPYITGPADFGQTGLIITRYTSERRAVAKKGEILLTVKGSGVGKAVFCDLDEVAISRQLMALNAIGWPQRFLMLPIRELAKELKLAARSLIPGISREDVDYFKCALPPLAEQHRIVAKVDELMSICDDLERAKQEREARRDRFLAATHHRLNNAETETADASTNGAFRSHAQFFLRKKTFDRLTTRPQDIKQLRQTILNLAVRGKLVPQDPNDEPASELLKRIEAEKARLVKEGKIRKPKPLPPIEPDEIPFEIPRGWEWVRLGAMGQTQTGTTPNKNDPENFGTHIPFIKPNDLLPASVNYQNEGLSELGLMRSGRIVPPGSLLMVCIGTIGKCQVVDRECSFNQQINALTPCGGTHPKFIFFGASSPFFQEGAWAASSCTTISILNKQRWEKLLFPLPPISEQRRIAIKVEELMAYASIIDSKLARFKNQQARLLETLLAPV